MHIIYGRSQSGKSNYIYEKIKRECTGKTFIVTPEQFSFSAEKRLVDTIQNGATTNVEVLSFERMAHRVMQSMGFFNKSVITKSGKAMIVYDAIAKHQKELKFLGKTQENVETVLTGITEFKKHNITVDTLRKKQEEENNPYLKAKLNDMRILYEELEKQTSDYIDENDVLTILASNIQKSHMFDGTTFYIDEFAGFTKQEYSVIRELNSVADVYIIVCSDEIKITKPPENDVFYDNKLTLQTLFEITDYTIKDEDIIRIEDVKKKPDLDHLEKNLFGVPYKSFNEECKSISLTLAQNPYEEIVNVAEEITRLVRNEGYRYKDISIISKEIDTYGDLAKVIFKEYEIPLFVDETKDLSRNILIRYALSIIDIFDQNFSYESMLNYLKTGFVQIDNLFELENYVIKYGIKGQKWYSKEWNEFAEEQNRIIEPLLTLKNNLSGRKNAKQISIELASFLETNLKEQHAEIEEDEELRDAWNIIIELLEEIARIFDDEQMSFERFSKLLKSGLQNRDLGQIPETQDKVILGDVDRSRSGNKKAVFIVGVNDMVFPTVNKSEGFFSDQERDLLKEEGFELAKTTIQRSYEENFNIYRAFTIAQERLFVSYSACDLDGSTLRKSSIITRLTKIFPKLEEKSVKIEKATTKEITFQNLLKNIGNAEYYEIYKWYENCDKDRLEKALDGINYSNMPQNISKDNIEKLYGNKITASVSKLETYEKCPFQYFLKYGLKLKEKETAQVNNMDLGSFLHDILDNFFKTTPNYKEIDDESIRLKIDELIRNTFESFEKFGLTPKYRSLILRLKKVLFYTIKYIVEGFKNSDFEVLGSEIGFGNKPGSKYPPIEIDLENGKKLIVEGKIDRVDIAKLQNGNFLRIIDYKTYSATMDYSKVYGGIELQLLTYAKVGLDNKEITFGKEDIEKLAKPAGILYYKIFEPKIKSIGRNIEIEDIENEIREQFKMKGIILADSNVVRSMDKRIDETNKSDAIEAQLLDSNTVKNAEKVVTDEEFQKLINYTGVLLKKISKEILTGKISINPTYEVGAQTKTPCEYCSYKNICGFDPKLKDNKYRIIAKLNKSSALDKM